MQLKLHYAGDPGLTSLVVPGVQPVQRLNFAMLHLEIGQSYEADSGGDEIGLVILTGTADVAVGAERFVGLGGRETVFDGKATGIYVPRNTAFALVATSALLEVAVCRTAVDEALPIQVVGPEQVAVRDVGGQGFRRYVHDILGVSNSQASQLIIGETFTLAGNWSSFPPHKHDTYLPEVEAQQEELYLYKIRPEQGFGLQLLYTRPDSPFAALDEALAVRQDDVTLMPYGFHPVAAPPGYDVYYLWFMAGTPRIMLPHDDPDHTWVKTASAEPRDFPA